MNLPNCRPSHYKKKWRRTLPTMAALLLMLSGSACSHEPLTISGQVVDGAGAALSDVTVWACYSSWGRSKGQLVWDKDYCSEKTRTDEKGYYHFTFKGPASSRLLAKKEGWVQTQDFNARQKTMVLSRSENYSSSLRAAAEQSKSEQKRRLAGEPATAYYCRVIIPAVRKVNLSYQAEPLAITPMLLRQDDRNRILFALQGSARSAKALSSEVLLRTNGEKSNRKQSPRSVEGDCAADVYFIEVDIPELKTGTETRWEILIPSLSALFDVQIWDQATLP